VDEDQPRYDRLRVEQAAEDSPGCLHGLALIEQLGGHGGVGLAVGVGVAGIGMEVDVGTAAVGHRPTGAADDPAGGLVNVDQVGGGQGGQRRLRVQPQLGGQVATMARSGGPTPVRKAPSRARWSA
jgi:hypothetical protein